MNRRGFIGVCLGAFASLCGVKAIAKPAPKASPYYNQWDIWSIEDDMFTSRRRIEGRVISADWKSLGSHLSHLISTPPGYRRTLWSACIRPQKDGSGVMSFTIVEELHGR